MQLKALHYVIRIAADAGTQIAFCVSDADR